MRLFIANWKMNLSYDEVQSIVLKHKEEMIKLAYQADIAVCPSYESIALMTRAFKDTVVKIGAQGCSVYERGSYTGEVSAFSLAQAGCQYAIVGHNERRQLFHETNEIIEKKVTLLLQAGICPVICIGETEEEREEGRVLEALENQLHFLKNIVAAGIVVAYEPVWAIGHGRTPSNPQLEKVFIWLQEYMQPYKKSAVITLIYGGSVDEESIKMLSLISAIEGFLIGGASTNFEKFKKIVLLGIQ